jgi:hypothetical protein
MLKTYKMILEIDNYNNLPMFSAIEIKKQETECSRLRKIYDFAKHGNAREVAAAKWEEARDLLKEMRVQNGETKFK